MLFVCLCVGYLFMLSYTFSKSGGGTMIGKSPDVLAFFRGGLRNIWLKSSSSDGDSRFRGICFGQIDQKSWLCCGSGRIPSSKMCCGFVCFLRFGGATYSPLSDSQSLCCFSRSFRFFRFGGMYTSSSETFEFKVPPLVPQELGHLAVRVFL